MHSCGGLGLAVDRHGGDRTCTSQRTLVYSSTALTIYTLAIVSRARSGVHVPNLAKTPKRRYTRVVKSALLTGQCWQTKPRLHGAVKPILPGATSCDLRAEGKRNEMIGRHTRTIEVSDRQRTPAYWIRRLQLYSILTTWVLSLPRGSKLFS